MSSWFSNQVHASTQLPGTGEGHRRGHAATQGRDELGSRDGVQSTDVRVCRAHNHKLTQDAVVPSPSSFLERRGSHTFHTVGHVVDRRVVGRGVLVVDSAHQFVYLSMQDP